MATNGMFLGLHWHAWLVLLAFAPGSVALSFYLSQPVEPMASAPSAPAIDRERAVVAATQRAAFPEPAPTESVARDERSQVFESVQETSGPAPKVAVLEPRPDDGVQNPFLPLPSAEGSVVYTQPSTNRAFAASSNRANNESANAPVRESGTSAAGGATEDLVSATGGGAQSADSGFVSGGGRVFLGSTNSSAVVTATGGSHTEPAQTDDSAGSALDSGNDSSVSGSIAGSGNTGPNTPASAPNQDSSNDVGDNDDEPGGLFETLSGGPPAPPAAG